MKRIALILMNLAIAAMVIGQNNVLIDEVEVSPPRFTGSGVLENVTQGDILTLNEYLGEQFYLEEDMGEYVNEGTVIVQFTVNHSGTVSDFQIINSVSPEVDAEVIRVLKSTDGMWLPGTRNKKSVAMEKEVSMVYSALQRDLPAVKEKFKKVARVNYIHGGNLFLKKGHPHRALKYYNRGIQYLPNDKALLLARGLCKYELGDKEGAFLDWRRLVAVGGEDYSSYFTENIQHLEGYNELLSFLAIDEQALNK